MFISTTPQPPSEGRLSLPLWMIIFFFFALFVTLLLCAVSLRWWIVRRREQQMGQDGHPPHTVTIEEYLREPQERFPVQDLIDSLRESYTPNDKVYPAR